MWYFLLGRVDYSNRHIPQMEIIRFFPRFFLKIGTEKRKDTFLNVKIEKCWLPNHLPCTEGWSARGDVGTHMQNEGETRIGREVLTSVSYLKHFIFLRLGYIIDVSIGTWDVQTFSLLIQLLLTHLFDVKKGLQ